MESDEVARIWARASRDPVFKAREVFDWWPWSKQREILWSVRNHARTAVPSAHGLGKTATAARCVLDFVTEGPCRVITTAPIWSQVEELLWAEIGVAYRDSKIPIGGELLKTKLTFDRDWFAVGFSTDEAERFAGHHAPRLLLVVDEASGVSEAIYIAAKGFLTASQGARVLLIGNPTRPAGTFFRACREQSPYNVIQMSAYDSPNITGEKVPAAVAAALPTMQWIEEMEEEYGRDSPEFRVRVMGQFATTLGRTFFNQQHIDTADELARDPLYTGRLTGDPTRGSRDNVRFLHGLADPSVTLYELRNDDHRYVIFADVAGAGIPVDEEEMRPTDKRDDASCATVLDLDTGNIVAVFHARLTEEKYALELARLGYLYNEAEIAVEATGGYGQLTIGNLLRTYRYPKLFRREKVDTMTGRKSSVYGWDTSTTTRPAMLNALRQAMQTNPAGIRSRDLLDEMRVFVWNDRGTKASAQSGSHDDRVLSAAGAHLLREIRSLTTIKSPITKPKAPLSARAVDGYSSRDAEPPPIIQRKRRLTVAQRATQNVGAP
jgi:hypothetical protein